ncbi:MAG: SMC-Scp complex subunit ScpB [Candidatus Methylomirabilis oxygeniifera]|uniref:Segregation and condensation protein B n=1 Tax=Methylomirabilis oxygeniifera TaxID=671143 RepID=D5MET1_METO1|nr:MAG: SMC-Scp complex subunit ScpB [Candidatus Methylomirabilis oxyfera]CBE68260.1 Segregation and condensation protein B [Candidatus Methylomirabilis oxyfera]
MDTQADLSPLGIIEALLFVSDAPVSLERIEAVLDGYSKAEVNRLLADLLEQYRQPDRGISLSEVAGGYRLTTKPEAAPWIQRLRGSKPARLSRAALETLALIAYKQPITKPEIVAVRGVMVDGVLKTLVERDLVRILGRKPEVGRPILYGTSRSFLEYFGFKDLSELPTLKEIEALAPNPAPERTNQGAAGKEASHEAVEHIEEAEGIVRPD